MTANRKYVFTRSEGHRTHVTLHGVWLRTAIGTSSLGISPVISTSPSAAPVGGAAFVQ